MANSREFSAKDVQISIFGRAINAISVSYSATQAKTNMYVLGKKTPYAKTIGRKEYEGEIVLPQSEFEALQRSLPAGKDVLDIAPTDVTILYLDEVTSFIVVDALKAVEFTSYTKEMAQDSEMMEVTLPLSIGDILLNVS